MDGDLSRRSWRARSARSSARAPLGASILWGLDGGILAILAVGIPYILTFYFMLALLEDSGYLNAAAFLTDRVMHRFGLHGRAVIPLIAAGGLQRAGGDRHALALEHARARHRDHADRAHPVQRADGRDPRARSLCSPAGSGPCSSTRVLIVVGIGAGLALNRILPGQGGPLVMEMFPFRRPVLRQVAGKTWRRFREFVWDAAPIILTGSIIARGAVRDRGDLASSPSRSRRSSRTGCCCRRSPGLTLLFAVLRKELALQLLIAFAAVSVAHGRATSRRS